MHRGPTGTFDTSTHGGETVRAFEISNVLTVSIDA